MAENENSTRSRRNKNRQVDILNSATVKRGNRTINDLISQASLNLYGTDRESDTEELTRRFNKVLASDIDQLTNKDNGDISSFLAQLVSSDNKTNATSELINNQFMALTGDEYGTMQSFIYEAYRNRILEQSDLHEVASQLIELSEAILITRDAIISADVVEGRMSRTLKFGSLSDTELDSAISIVETVEKKFGILEKIKNFIVPKTLEYGSYYMYIIPYSRLFNDFVRLKNDRGYGRHNMYGESTVMESCFNYDETNVNKNTKVFKSNPELKEFKAFIESAYNDYVNADTSMAKNMTLKGAPSNIDTKVCTKEEFEQDMMNMLNNITVSNDPVPIPVLEEGFESINEFKESFVTEAGDQLKEGMIKDGVAKYFHESGKEGYTTEENGYHKPTVKNDLFNAVANGKYSNTSDNGIFQTSNPAKKKKGEFDDIRDCYTKLIEPIRIIPIEIMSTTIGYYYVVDEDITPLSGGVSSTLYYAKFDEHRRESTVVDAIAAQVVKSFDKKFLTHNSKFKKTIVDCINYYNLNEKKLKFQFIPVEYMQVFKIDEDVDGHGQSMIKKSLFYAKLYLMLLLFKIMSIILNSNDTKVNYLKKSGIDKNLSNQVENIARIRQNRQINMSDLFSYTTLINKVGDGTEMYIPTGRSGERLLETEILQGQDIQLNTELLEMLKNAYILGTGVPAAIVNYLNEADFAKQIEQNNTKFNGRVVNYQLDFNPSITEMYRKILRYSSNLSESEIEDFEFSFQAPKSINTSTKSEVISNFTAVQDFVVQLLIGDTQNDLGADPLLPEIVKQFKILLAKDQLPMLNIDHMAELLDEAKLLAKEESLAPNPANGDNGDLGIDGIDDIGTGAGL